MQVIKNDTLQYTRYYFGSYELTEYPDNSYEQDTWFTVNGGIFGFNRATSTTDSTYYVIKDHLGSLMTIAGEEGNAREYLSYDAWGRRRNAANWSYDTTLSVSYTSRGYTGHEHNDEACLINMNGRVYDPIIGLFISPDPVIQSPTNPLNYNLYSYCLNNPLKYTDPSGYTLSMSSSLYNSIMFFFNAAGDGETYYGGRALRKHMASDGRGGSGGSWQPVYKYSVSTSGRLGGFYPSGLQHGDPKFRWAPGNFRINFSADIVDWEWVPNESDYNYSVGPWSNETLDQVYGSEIDYSAPGINLNPINPSVEGHGGSGGRNNSLYMVSTGLNAASFATSLGQYSNVYNGMWRGLNGKWYSTSWQGNQWAGPRSSVMSRAGAFKLASRGFFYAGVLVSGYQGFSSIQNGDYAGAVKSGLDIGMAAIATFGNVPGLIIGGGYFLLDAFGAFERPYITPYILPTYAVPDNTYVAPPIRIPYP